ncbi:TetR/AcrR family transcriptional regulator [Modestobacter excelsi]|uniref:TetR/AcrR family transcriptional regulator n=1 Tax=Modestobacter excelsi TaxID=2213161 RepID=UPI00110CB167|nr:TetR/AcrR family transcriptional regulator [Modestobacter excelsi]
MAEDLHLSLRERTRRAVQAELVDVAQRLFVEHGYEATTVDSITEAAGLSKRSFFRYFASKEDLVLGKYDLLGEQLQASLAARPAEEPVWTALRRMFDDVVTYTGDRDNSARMEEMERIVSTSPALNAAYLQRLDQIQTGIATIVRNREAQAGRPRASTDPAPEAIVGAAFACMAAARRTATQFSDQPLDGLLDRAMTELWTFDR